MAEWEVIRLATNSNGVWTLESAQIIADYMNGEVKMAYADLGIKRIYIHYWYVTVDLDTTQTDVPLIWWDGSVTALLAVSSGEYYHTSTFLLITLDETATYVTTIGTDSSVSGTWNVLEGDGFVALKQTSTSSNNTVVVFDTATNLITGDSVDVIVDSNGYIYDFKNGNIANGNAVAVNTISETDGTLYVEVMKCMALTGESPRKYVFQADHTYYPIWDYDSGRDKNVLINGIKFNRMGASVLYVPVE